MVSAYLPLLLQRSPSHVPVTLSCGGYPQGFWGLWGSGLKPAPHVAHHGLVSLSLEGIQTGASGVDSMEKSLFVLLQKSKLTFLLHSLD